MVLTGTTITASGLVSANGGLTTTVATANALTLGRQAANLGGATTIWLDFGRHDKTHLNH